MLWPFCVRELCFFFLALVSMPPTVSAMPAQPTGTQTFESRPPPPPPPPPDLAAECLAVSDDPVLSEAVRALRFAVGNEAHELKEVRLSGLATLQDAWLWRQLGGVPERGVLPGQAATILMRLSGTGLFRRVTPTVRVEQGGAVLELALEEHPVVRKVSIRGLRDSDAAYLLDILFAEPDEEGAWSRTAFDSTPRRRRRKRTSGACAPPTPNPQWIARAEGSTLHPGIVWRGLVPALERVVHHLHKDGYLLASVDATLGADGTLILSIDEGRLGGVRVTGVEPRILPDVTRRLGLRPGDVFLVADLGNGLGRVRSAYPFLRPSGASWRPRDLVRVVEQPAGRYRSEPAPRGAPRSSRERRKARVVVHVTARRLVDAIEEVAEGRDVEEAIDELEEDLEDLDDLEEPEEAERAFFELDGRELVVHLRADNGRLSSDPVELLRHTQAEGFAPGLAVAAQLWDPADRAHLVLDGALNVAINRGSRTPATGETGLSRVAAGERASWLVGPRVQLPALGLAEVGAQFHSLSDTADRWRLDALDSYLYSALFNRPEAEYFRRTGVSAFVTAHLFEQLTAGAEYRYDRYDTLAPLDDAVTLFNSDELPFPNPAIDDGAIGSVLLRLEWSTERKSLHRVGERHRHPETSLVWRPFDARPRIGLRVLQTLELARSALGGSPALAFTRFVTDLMSYVRIGRRQELRLRLRAAGGDDLPRQYQEALGGWNALRGYDFKEFRGGELSLLGMGEYRYDVFGLFADLGTIDRGGGLLTPRVGVGAALHLGNHAHLALAWRTDERADGVPEVRFFFARPF